MPKVITAQEAEELLRKGEPPPAGAILTPSARDVLSGSRATAQKGMAAQKGAAAPKAAEALKLLTGMGSALPGRLLMLDARRMSWTDLGVARDPRCPCCGRWRG